MELRMKARLASSMPEIENEIGAMRRTVMTRAYADIRAATLTPDKAMAYWFEMFSYERLENRLRDSAAGAENLVERS